MVEEGSIGPYRIVRRLGFGRSSEVLLATRKFPGDFERRVVIKRLLAPCEDEADRQAVLATEALAYARVAHPAIVQLFDFFSHEGSVALVLEYVDGPHLSRLQASLRAHRESMGDRVAYFIASRIFAALAAAHSARDPRTGTATPVIHRDVSPDNVFVPWDGFVKLGDFDLAKVIGVTGETRGGLLKGTYGYMAPEQVKGEPVTPRTDVYAGCLVLRELLLSRPAFDEDMPELELLRAMEASRLAPIESIRGGISRRLADAMRRGLARDPEERTLTAAEMVDVLRSEGDQELAHAELISILARHRPANARGSSSQLAPTPPAGVPAMTGPTPATGIPALNRILPPSTSPFAVTVSASAADAESRGTYDTPRTMTYAPDSLPPIERAPSSSIFMRRPTKRPIVFGAAFACAVLAIGAFVVVRPDVQLGSAASEPVAETVERLPPENTFVPTAAPAVVAASVAPTPGDAASDESTLPSIPSALGELVTPAAARGHRVWVDGKVEALSSGVTLRVPCGTHVVRVGSTGESSTVVVPCGGSVVVGAPRIASAPGAKF